MDAAAFERVYEAFGEFHSLMSCRMRLGGR